MPALTIDPTPLSARAAAPAAASRSQVRQAEPRDMRFTREEYHRLIEIGLLDGRKVELIRGRMIELRIPDDERGTAMPPIGEEHGMSSMNGARVLRQLFPEDRYTVRSALPFVAAGESEPEPDLCVVQGFTRSVTAHPRVCLLLIEISHSTLDADRRLKGPLYAESGVADYWIVNLIDKQVEVYRNPRRIADGSWSYDAAIVRKPGESIDLLAMPGAAVAVNELLP